MTNPDQTIHNILQSGTALMELCSATIILYNMKVLQSSRNPSRFLRAPEAHTELHGKMTALKRSMDELAQFLDGIRT